MDSHSAELFLSTVTIAEIEDGIAKAQREGATRKARDLTAWLETVLHLYAARILPFDLATARRHHHRCHRPAPRTDHPDPQPAAL
jgi:predicted nucleic acid-binding protein